MKTQLVERFPFVLPEHALKEQAEFDKVNAEPWEKVGIIGGKTIRRKPKTVFTLAEAIRPSAGETLRINRTISSGDLEADRRTAHELAETAYEALTRLATMARAGDGKALWQFAEVINRATRGLSQITQENPVAIRPIARVFSKWPMMMSRHPLNCDAKGILDHIQLGEDGPARLDKYSKIKPDAAARVALRLVEHVTSIRQIDPVLPERKRLTQILPEFTSGCSLVWWRFAEEFLLASYPRPHDIAELAIIADERKRSRPGDCRKSILAKIKARFLHLAK